ncbi:MAG: GNAT family N-acetyltransferase [Campylobacterota bacterium]|nr:GNAT family N-acetyltransferase [Campylobacterota bacterium]
MQIREISLKELYTVYDVICELYVSLSYREFEDLIYDMRHMEYKMFGVFEKESLVTYAGLSIQTTLVEKRHLRVFDFVTSSEYDKLKYDEIMKEYLNDYAKIAMCTSIKYES